MHSMTGCGAGRAARDGWEVTAEIRSVNHRFLDISMRLPRNISFLENTVRTVIGESIRRGHLDVYLTVRRTEASSICADADYDLAGTYMQMARKMAEMTGSENDMTVSRLMQMEGVVTVTEKELDQELVSAICCDAVSEAIAQLTEMRRREGINLQHDLQYHLTAAADLRLRILEVAPSVVTEYREKLENRLKAMISEGVEPQRLAQEVALMADRCAIDEELSRLDSHIRQMNAYLSASGEIGKKMDFLIQEMNREANTIGSKASDARIAQLVVDLKSEIEKLREQIQNVE